MSADALLTWSHSGSRLELVARGAWTAPHAVELERLMDSMLSQPATAQSSTLDMGGIGAFDTYGAWLVERLLRTWQTRGHTMQILDLADRYQGLFQQVHHAEAAPQTVTDRPRRLLRAADALGRALPTRAVMHSLSSPCSARLPRRSLLRSDAPGAFA